MQLSKDDYLKYLQIVKDEISRAESIWQNNKRIILSHLDENQKTAKARDLKTDIPGYEFIPEDSGKVDTFVCLVMDIRGSTRKMLCAHKKFDDPIQRAFYETSAVLSLTSAIIQEHGGSVTEYLGDGVLALFQETEKFSYKPYDSSKKIIQAIEQVATPYFEKNYDVPPIEVGIGLARSKAIICSYGFGKFKQGKVFGRCVYDASKLANDKKNFNAIFVQKLYRQSWPTGKGGKLRFNLLKSSSDVEGYELIWRDKDKLG